jgi:hypothetical protein
MIDNAIFSATLDLLGRDPKRKEQMLIEIHNMKCCEDKNLHEYSDDCRCCVNTCNYCKESLPQEDYPTTEEMFNKLKETAPAGWVVSDEYHFIGVNHPALTQEQFIAFGNVNTYFGFNDENADTVCGDMEIIYNADEIAQSFWFQLSEFYPELFKESN